MATPSSPSQASQEKPGNTYSDVSTSHERAPEPVFYSGLEVANGQNPAGYYKPYEQYNQNMNQQPINPQAMPPPGVYSHHSSPVPPHQQMMAPPQQQAWGQQAPLPAGTAPPPQPTSDSKILGLRKSTFILTMLLILVIVIAAVGGGVGGSMAVENAKKNAIASGGAVSTVTVTVTSGAAGGATDTASSTKATSTTSAVTGTISSFTAPTNVVIALDCPNIDKSSQSIQLGSKTYTYKVACNIDYNGANIDIMALTAYSFRDCLKACSSFNRNQNSTECQAVEFNGNLPSIVPNNFGNCFLKSNAGTANQRVDNTHAGATLESST